MPLVEEIDLKSIKAKNSDRVVFVETGSHLGDGVQKALNCGFSEVRTIENMIHYVNFCKNRFANDNRVKVFHGSSREILYDVCKDIQEQIVFWLDGHYSGGDTGKDDYSERPYCPLYEEIEQINRLLGKNHVIMIDDMRVVRENSEWKISEEEIQTKILQINSKYKIRYIDTPWSKNDILIAEVETVQ